MRLVRMNVAGFRGFDKEADFDLDADVIVLSGSNGTGKTSFFDAILWGLTGSIERIGPKISVVNRFAEFGEARVELVLRAHDGSDLQVIRRLSGAESLTETLAVTSNGLRERGSAARALLLSKLHPSGDGSDESFASLSRWLTKSVYLEQDKINAFVQAIDEQQRFEIVGELIGAASLTKLNRELDSARRAWTTATNRRRAEISSMRQIRSGLVDRLNDIDSSIVTSEIIIACVAWSRATNRVVRRGETKIPTENASAAAWASAIDRAIARVSADLRALELLSSDIARARGSLTTGPTAIGDPSDVRAAVEELQRRVVQAAGHLNSAEEAVSQARRTRLAQTESSRSLASMAQLALKHVGEFCPVCNQEHDLQATERRLRALVERADLPSDIPEELSLAEAADILRDLESQLASEKARLHTSESAFRQLDERRAQLESSAESLGLAMCDTDDVSDALDLLESEVHSRAGQLRELRETGMALSASLARAIEAGEAARWRHQVGELTDNIASQESECVLRDRAYEDARTLHVAIRDVEDSFVEDKLVQVGDLLQVIYSTVDPHPEFKAVRFLTDRHRGRGRLWTTLEAATNDDPIVVNEPMTVLSSSQLNVLAVATFMSLNLSIEHLALEVMALDDPLQTLDNVNLLGLADLLRRLRGRRQIIISTHDDRLAGLLERKLRPLGAQERTKAFSLSAWDRSGPVVTAREVERDSGRLHLAVT